MSVEKTGSVLKVALEYVEAKPRPVDRGIMKSMAEVRQLYPIIAIYDIESEKWKVWDGHTRVACARELGWEKIDVFPATDAFEAERKAAAISLAANQRSDNPLAEGQLLVELDDDDYAVQKLGMSRAEVNAKKRLAENLAPEIKEQVEDGTLPISAARKLVQLPQDEQRKAYEYAEKLMEEHNKEPRRQQREVPRVSEVDAAVRKMKGQMQPAIPTFEAPNIKEGASGMEPVAVAAQVKLAMEKLELDDEERGALLRAVEVLEAAG